MAQDYSAEKFRAFQFFIGVVEDRADPAEQGRVKVRCFGIQANRMEPGSEENRWREMFSRLGTAGWRSAGSQHRRHSIALDETDHQPFR